MKRKNLYGILTAVVLVGVNLSSCSKFLEVEPKEVLTEDQMYRDIFDADAAVIGVYGKFLGLAEQHVLWNELRADLLTVTPQADPYLHELSLNDVTAISANNPYVNPRKFYEVILTCNDVLKNFTAMRNENKLDVDQYSARYSDIMAVRTWIYLQLGVHFGKVPYVTDPLENMDEVLDQSKYSFMEFNQLLPKLIADMEAIPSKRIYNTDESLRLSVDGFIMERFFINKYALLGDLYLWHNDYTKAADAYKNVMTYYDNQGNDDWTFNYYKLKERSVTDNNDLSIGYLRNREQDVRTFINSKTQGWRSMFSRTQDGIWNSEWVWTLPFSSNFGQGNPFIRYFAINGGEYLLKPSQEIIDQWDNQTQWNGVPYDGRKVLSVADADGMPVVTKYLDQYTALGTLVPIDQYNKGGKWFLYRAAKLHLRFAEAANRDGKHKVAYALLNNGIRTNYDNSASSDKTDLQQTQLPWPYDFDARMGQVPYFRGVWHRNEGIRGRAYLRNRVIENPADSLIHIENYLVEESALEQAFEGSRWEDLLRIALRRSDPAYLADKVYNKLSKDGNPNADAVRSKLMQQENWYLPFRWKE
ncbi:RagB/SusD family nutrient uptake outer membrane protein [Sphingobacterium olei]|uniref:RagB/SusD family nutrient uptake outer membrane protein n=1 Tax=Sphingobacterium olei TaxID=2571155 RepID=A0A4U0P3J9_9SPHI|nr:RagB/SusD family nutrient uptake outer membrane protein [Sphingobacterium olei]TJZ61799.1 RagB/SusD family nutrient uptake outer membrane protein [Sphingobacterium olei]